MSSGAYALITQRGTITQIHLKNGKQEQFEIKNGSSIFAIELDIKNDCLFWADKMQSSIYRNCMRKGEDGSTEIELSETLVQFPFGGIEGMSYDWVSGLLYFVDATRARIEVINPSDSKTVNRLRRTIIRAGNSTDKRLPKLRGIAVHPLKGYLFWTDWSWFTPSISRSNLDGSDIRELLRKPDVEGPHGITIDFKSDQLYWTDNSLAIIGRCEMDGSKRTIIARTIRFQQQSFAIGIEGNDIYFSDLAERHIYKLNKGGFLLAPIQ